MCTRKFIGCGATRKGHFMSTAPHVAATPQYFAFLADSAMEENRPTRETCLLYTSDAADE